MPTYQYVCTECGDQVEAVQKFTDDPLSVHDTCGGRLRKVFSPVGIVFKGSGFYRTDSRKAAAKAEESGAKAAKSGDSSGPGEGSSEAKKDKKDSASSDGKKSAPAKASQPAAAKSGS